VLYTGTGSIQTVSGVGFQPDFTWIKSRSNTDQHNAQDILRYHGILIPNTTAAEGDTGGGWLRSWNSDGFSVDVNGPINTNTQTYVAWNWKANGSGSANTTGSINTTSTSANVDAGFSIVSWAGTGTAGGQTIGHGLSSAPEMIITKRRNDTGAWYTYHSDMTSYNYELYLNDTSAETAGGQFQHAAPTSSVFTVYGDGALDTSGGTYIAYCFHSVDGYSKVGSYKGNGSVDGTFVYTGFKPAYVMLKDTTLAGEHWVIFDSTRDIDNVMTHRIYANSSTTEGNSGTALDLVSNGFKMREGVRDYNGSGDTYIFLAFSEQPFKYSNAR
jgi:hypothetical protein